MSQPDAAFLGIPRIISFEGVDYKIGLITGKVKGEFERKMLARATQREAEKHKRGTLNRAEYQAELRLIGDREDAGEYSIEKVNARGAMFATWCQKMLFELLIPDASPEVLDRMLDERADELQYHLAHIITESFQKTMKANAEISTDPFVQTEQESPPIVSQR